MNIYFCGRFAFINFFFLSSAPILNMEPPPPGAAFEESNEKDGVEVLLPNEKGAAEATDVKLLKLLLLLLLSVPKVNGCVTGAKPALVFAVLSDTIFEPNADVDEDFDSEPVDDDAAAAAADNENGFDSVVIAVLE